MDRRTGRTDTQAGGDRGLQGHGRDVCGCKERHKPREKCAWGGWIHERSVGQPCLQASRGEGRGCPPAPRSPPAARRPRPLGGLGPTPVRGGRGRAEVSVPAAAGPASSPLPHLQLELQFEPLPGLGRAGAGSGGRRFGKPERSAGRRGRARAGRGWSCWASPAAVGRRASTAAPRVLAAPRVPAAGATGAAGARRRWPAQGSPRCPRRRGELLWGSRWDLGTSERHHPKRGVRGTWHCLAAGWATGKVSQPGRWRCLTSLGTLASECRGAGEGWDGSGPIPSPELRAGSTGGSGDGCL